MSVANMEAFALTQGIKKQWKEMSQAEQTLLRYNFLMENSKDAQGDFARTSQGFANQLRIAQTQLKQMGATLATYVLPHLNGMLIKFNDFIKWLPVLGKMFVDKFNQFKPTLIAGKQQLVELWQALAKFGQVIWNEISPAINSLKNGGFTTIWNTVKDAIKGILDKATETFNYLNDNWSKIKPFVEGITIAFIGYKAVLIAINTWTKIVTASQWLWNLAMNSNPVGLIVMGIGLLIGIIISLVQNWDAVKKKTKEVWDMLMKNPIAQFIINTNPFLALLVTIINNFDKITSAIKKAWEWLTKWNKTDAKKKDVSVEGSTVGQNAKGTNFWRGGLTSIHERGGEIIDLPRGSRVYPHDKSIAMAKQEGMNQGNGKVSNNNITINVNANNMKALIK
jgi:hypothetical protein